VQRIRDNCGPILRSGRDALVPVILDGENAWEHYYRNGRPFLSDLYRMLEASDISVVTVSEALTKVEDDPVNHIHPGSWINANFDVWIGFDEDNRAWELLLKAREAFASVTPGSVPEADYQLAQEELLIAEGSDWCWWYGPHHDSENRQEFDELYRVHLANLYRALRLTPPAELSRPILRPRVTAVLRAPVSDLTPVLDGQVTSYFEWLWAGSYRVDGRSGSMHGRRFLVKELLYGTSAAETDPTLYLRLDFLEAEIPNMPGTEVRFQVDGKSVRLRLDEAEAVILESEITGAKAAYRDVLEFAMPLPASLRARVEVSIWQDGLPIESLPADGALEIAPL
jgi:hypothetical protein